MRIFITGHISPDVDTVASAVEYADYLKQAKRYAQAELIPVLPGKPNNETVFVFDRFGIDLPKILDDYEIEETDAFILVDHNEESQRHKKIVDTQVIEIVDHHKINVNFTSPVRIDVRPFGSTSTIIHELYEMYGHNISKKIAGLMLSGILSDTVGLKSSLTTGYDSEVAHKLAEQLNVNLDELTFELFKAKSDLSGLSPKEIASKDVKVFDFGGNKVFINQVETVEPDKVLELKADLIEALNEIKAEVGAGQGYIIITDILNINSKVIYTNEVEKEIVEEAFTTQGHENLADIGPKMSRKKDIAPEIERVQK